MPGREIVWIASRPVGLENSARNPCFRRVMIVFPGEEALIPVFGSNATQPPGLVGDPGFAFAVFYWCAYGSTQESTGCALVNTYEPGRMAANQYANAKGITPCATNSKCSDAGTCSYIS